MVGMKATRDDVIEFVYRAEVKFEYLHEIYGMHFTLVDWADIAYWAVIRTKGCVVDNGRDITADCVYHAIAEIITTRAVGRWLDESAPITAVQTWATTA